MVGSFPVLLVGCGVGGESPSSIARTYEQAVVSHDGARLCATFAPKMREVIAEQVTQQQTTAAAGKAHFDCGAFYNVLLGYPHENIDRKFIGGKLLGIGRARFVRRKGVLYARVPAKVKLDYVYTGYTIDRRREKGTTRFEDVVWLSKTAGAWRVVKPSLGLVAATGSPDVLGEQYLVAHVDAPPPDPDYSLNRAERIRAEAADYRASFRRPISHTALRCMDKGLSVSDRLGDAVTYRPQSPGLPAAAPAADDIERVNVRAAGHIICVAVTFAKKPSGQLSIGFTPHWRKTFFGTYIVEIKPGLGVRGGGLTTSYRYFRGGYRLNTGLVKEISLYGTTVAFAADTTIGRPPPAPFSADNLGALYWQVRSSARTGVDEVPNERHGKYLLIRQSDGRVVAPPNG